MGILTGTDYIFLFGVLKICFGMVTCDLGNQHQGEKVEFEVVSGPKGFQATNVTGPGGAAVRGDPRIGRHRMMPNYNLYNRGNYGMNAYGQPPMYGGNQIPMPNVQVGYGNYPQGNFPTDLSTPRSSMQPNRNATPTGGFTGQPGYNPTSLYGNGGSSGFVGNPLGNGNFAGQPANFSNGQQSQSFNGYDNSGFPNNAGSNAQFAPTGSFGGSA
ncbi:hypothetical protein IWQ62_005811 [Dispira parvispora]|uniref:Uncharacterized protein n=1 Tax=Dispira parvispora TaxID=1520584 RepID=A0A9W8DZ89_9FUNG|nr:hypothetical protein IWQ62_005811 [Dispira parvispora]